MTGTGQRAARASLDATRAAVDQLERAASPEDSAASLIEAWGSMEQSLQALAGTTALQGQPLLRELRQRNLLSLAEAHAIVDFASVAERARQADYVLTPRDRDTARAALDELASVVDRGGPAAAGPPPSAIRAANAAPPSAEIVAAPGPAPSRNVLGRGVVAAALVAILGGAGYAAWAFTREPAALRTGRAAYAAGDRVIARNAFTAAAAAHPELAEPHVYLGRLAREQGDLVTANEELRRAVALEPGNFLTHRELGALLLLSRRPDLARAFYERAIRLNPDDRTSLGYMGCTMLELGRPDLAQRFLSRAGAGPWSACVAVPPQAPPGAAPAAPPR